MLYLYSHNAGSRGAKALAEELGIKRIRHNSRFVPGNEDWIINWGASHPVPKLAAHTNWINDPNAVGSAANKLNFFNALKEHKWLPWFTTDRQKAAEQIAKGNTIVCRKIVNGSGGAGIVLARQPEDLVDAPLYVRYVPKKVEYRIHVARKADELQVIDMQMKARKMDVPENEVNWQIRNHANGFIYKRGGIDVPETVKNAAKECLAALNELDFGAVDVVVNSKTGKPAVLEINSAPGLEGQTVKNYAKYFKELIDG